MHKLDVKWVTRLCSKYVTVLDLQSKILLVWKDALNDPELAGHVKAMIQELRKSFGSYAVFSSLISQQLTKQHMMLLIDDDFPEMMTAHLALSNKLSEIVKVLDQFAEKQPSASPPPQSKGDPQEEPPRDNTTARQPPADEHPGSPSPMEAVLRRCFAMTDERI